MCPWLPSKQTIYKTHGNTNYGFTKSYKETNFLSRQTSPTYKKRKFQIALSISKFINQNPRNQSTKKTDTVKTNLTEEKKPQKKEERKFTGTGLLSGELVNQDHNSNEVNGFRCNKEVVAIFDEKLESKKGSQRSRDSQEDLHFDGLPPHPSKQDIERRIRPPPPHPFSSST